MDTKDLQEKIKLLEEIVELQKKLLANIPKTQPIPYPVYPSYDPWIPWNPYYYEYKLSPQTTITSTGNVLLCEQ